MAGQHILVADDEANIRDLARMYLEKDGFQVTTVTDGAQALAQVKQAPPDLLVLATELAGVGGINLPVEVSAIDSFASVTDAPERSLSMVARIPIDLADVYLANDKAFCDTLDRCRDISLFLLERADQWLGED